MLFVQIAKEKIYLLLMKRLVLLFVALLLCIPLSVAQKREPGKVKTLVIDPGHGGAKPGAISKRITEKDLVLNVAKKFGALVEQNFPDVKVIYTRSTDVDINLSARADVANHVKADLFVSIHANSHPTSTPSGVETYVMGLSKGKANMEVAKKENADILLESDYKSNAAYQGFDPNSPESNVMFAMYQNAYITKSLDFASFVQKQYAQNTKSINRGVKQAELFVIYKTAMPSVLTEIGFISNSAEEAFLASREGQEKIALSLYNAFAQYKAREEGTSPKLMDHFHLANSSSTAVADSKADHHDAKNDVDSHSHTPTVPAVPLPDPPSEAAPVTAVVDIPLDEAKADDKAPAAVVDQHVEEVKTPAAPVAAVPEAKPADQEAAKETEPARTAVPDSLRVVFRVQFMRSDKLLEAGDRQLHGLDTYDYYMQNNAYCYLWGKCSTIEAAKQIQSDVRQKGFADAFVVAFQNDKRISLQLARELLKE